MGEVKISAKRLQQLERSQRILDALEAGGVDNWEWYSESLKDFRKEEELENIIQDYVNEILEVCSDEGDVEYPAGRECGHSILLGGAEDGVYSLLQKFMQEVIDTNKE